MKSEKTRDLTVGEKEAIACVYNRNKCLLPDGQASDRMDDFLESTKSVLVESIELLKKGNPVQSRTSRQEVPELQTV